MSNLIDEIDGASVPGVTLWWMGRAGFAIKHHTIIFYIDPALPDGIEPEQITNADMLLRTHVGADENSTVARILSASTRAKVIVPKSNADALHATGVGYQRMTTTDSDLRVEYFKGGVYARVYSVPSAKNGLKWTPLGGYPYLGYLMRFGGCTVYHAGVGGMYDGLVNRLKPYDVTVALLPIGGDHFSIEQAATLGESIGARWVVPVTSQQLSIDRFIDHLLGFHPDLGFKIFEVGERWDVPEIAE